MFLEGVSRVVRRPIRSLGVAALALTVMAGSRSAGGQVPGELRGLVSDATAGRAIAGARIDIAGRVEPARSDADGSFVVRGLEPHAYAVTIYAVGYAALRRDITIENGRTTTLDVSLEPLPKPLGAVVSSATRAETNEFAFDRPSIDASGRRDVGELIAAVPGLVVTRAGGPGQPAHASIRGSSASEVLVVVDGVILNSPLTGVADLSQLTLASIERVTVLEGGQSSRYGGRALAGAIVVETRRARRDASFGIDAGSWGERALSATLGGGSTASGLLSAERRSTRDDFPYDVPAVRGGGTARRANAGATTTSVLAVGGLDGPAGSLRARADWRSTSRGVAGSVVQPSLTGRDDERHVSASLDLASNPGPLSVDGSASVSHERAHLSDPTPPFGTPYDDRLSANEARVASAAALTGPHTAATIGGDARLVAVRSTALTSASPPSQRITGAYAALRATCEALGSEISGAFNGRVDRDDLLAGTAVSPRASLELTRGWASLSGSIGDGYSPPSLADQFFHEGVLVKANPSLAPERTRGEAELRAAVRELTLGVVTLRGDAAVYRADVHGMILWAPDFRFIWSPLNVDVRRSGWQLGGRLAAPTFFGAAIDGGVDHTDVTYASAAQSGQVIYRPRVTAHVSESMALRLQMRVDAQTRYVGSRRTVAGTDLNSLDPYWLTDLHLSVPIARAAWRLDGVFGVENVFDRPASMLVDFPFGGRRWTVGLRTSRRTLGESG